MSQSKKYLIVNADDFGISEEVNKVIIKSFREGIVTSVSIMPTGDAFDHAVMLAKEYGGLDVGVHLSLTECSPVLPATTIPTLVNNKNKFHKNWRAFVLRLLMGKICVSEIEQELEAQIKRVIDAGLYPTHIDSHEHIHILPFIWGKFSRLAYKYNIRHIRYPYERNIAESVSLTHALRLLSVRGILNFIPWRNDNNLAMRSNFFMGLSASEKLTVDVLRKYLKNLKDGETELMCHPNDKFDGEINALTDKRIINLIDELGVTLGGYKKLNG